MRLDVDALEGDDSVRDVLVPPTVAPASVASAMAESLADDGRDALVLTEDDHNGPTAVRGRSLEAQRLRTLDRAGWTVPSPIVHAGTPIVLDRPSGGPTEAWVDPFVEGHPEHRDWTAVIEEPADLVDALDQLLRAGIVPHADGFDARGEGAIRGDEGAIRRRLDRRRAAVDAIDRTDVEQAIETERDAAVAFAHDALSAYLGWSLEHGRMRDPHLGAFAAAAASEPIADQVIVATARHPAGTTRGLADALARETNTFVAPAGGDGAVRPAWYVQSAGWTPAARRTTATYHIRSGPDDAWTLTDAPVAGDDGPPTRTIPADDPASRTSEILDTVVDTGTLPGDSDVHVAVDEMVVLATSRTRARRVMRLGRTRDLPVVRTGPVEVCRTRPAVLTRAWLRIVTGRDARAGWAVVLEEAGCSPGDIEAWFDGGNRPSVFAAFRSDLRRLEGGLATVARVMDRYGVDPRVRMPLVAVLTSVTASEPGPMAVLDALEDGYDRRCTAPLEAPPSGRIHVTTSGGDGAGRSVVLLCGRSGRPGPSGVVFRPPLGLRRTRTVRHVDGHPLEGTHPAWATCRVLTEVSAEVRRRERWGASLGADRLVVVGSPA